MESGLDHESAKQVFTGVMPLGRLSEFQDLGCVKAIYQA